MRKQLGDNEFMYEIACAQLCGLGHYSMRGYVTIHEQAEYDAWLAEEGAKLSSEDSVWN
jgi:cytochrome c oxidase subunit 2